MADNRKANYGLDAPGLVRFFLIFGLALFLAGVALIGWRKNGLLVAIGFTCVFPGFIFFVEGLLMMVSSGFGKLKARDRLLDKVINLKPGKAAAYADGMADTVDGYTDEVSNLTEALKVDHLTISARAALTNALSRSQAAAAKVTAAFGGGE